MEVESRRFYEKAAARTADAGSRQLLDDLAQEERSHEVAAEKRTQDNLQPNVKQEEDEARRRLFVLQIVQPGLAGLMDGSVSTLAPVFAAALATRNSWDAFAVGLAASIGAGISMGFTEALSDDGSLTGRGHPWMRGLVCGLMTTLRRRRPHTAFPDSRFPCRDDRRHRRGAGGAGVDHVDPASLHGDTAALRSFTGRPRRRIRLSDRHPDRQFVAAQALVPAPHTRSLH